jgi:hypothetical protein
MTAQRDSKRSGTAVIRVGLSTLEPDADAFFQSISAAAHGSTLMLEQNFL